MTSRAILFTTAITSAFALLSACGGKEAPADANQNGGAAAANPANQGSSLPGQIAPSGPTTLRAKKVVSAGFVGATSIAELGPNLYVTTKSSLIAGNPTQNGVLFQIPKAGGNPLLIASDRFGAAYTSIAFEADTILIGTSDGRIMRVPTFGGNLTEVFSGAPPIVSLATDENRIYFAHAEGSVLSIDKSGGGATLVSTPGGQVRAISLVQNQLYIASDNMKTGALTSIATFDGTSKTVAATGGALCGLSLANDAAYITSLDGAVISATLAGGVVSPIAMQQSGPCGVASDTAKVYWLGAQGTNVWRADAAGTNAEAIAEVDHAVSSAHALVVDVTSLFVLADTEVVSVAK